MALFMSSETILGLLLSYADNKTGISYKDIENFCHSVIQNLANENHKGYFYFEWNKPYLDNIVACKPQYFRCFQERFYAEKKLNPERYLGTYKDSRTKNAILNAIEDTLGKDATKSTPRAYKKTSGANLDFQY